MRSHKDLRRLLLRSAVLAFFAVLFEWMNLLGIPDATHQIGATAFFRVVGAATAPFERQPSSDDEPIVLIFDQTSLNIMHKSWPLDFNDQAKFLRLLEGFEPRAIFYDIAFYQHRDGEDAFAAAIRETTGAKPRKGLPCGRDGSSVPDTPIFLAQPGSRPPLQSLCDAGAQSVLVSWIGDPNTYPIKACDDGKPDCLPAGQGCRESDPGHEPCGHRMDMAATQLWRVWCRNKDCGHHDYGLQLFDIAWRVRADPDQEQFRIGVTCMTGWEQFRQALAPQDNPNRICPQALVVPAASLQYCDDSDPAGSCENRKVLRKRIRGHVVIIGAQLAGLRDQIYSPVFGPVPGVFVHAAAFSNLVDGKLLVRKQDYFADAAEPFISLATARAFLVFFVTLMVLQLYLEWVNGLAVPLTETSELVLTPSRWFFHRRLIRFHERMDWLRTAAQMDSAPHLSVLRNSLTTLLLIALAVVLASAIALAFAAVMYFQYHESPVLWVGEAMLVVTLSIPEIAATAICAFVSPLLFLAPGRRLLRAFLDPPRKEESHEDVLKDDIVEIDTPN